MPSSNRDADFWWLRYGAGIALPALLAIAGLYSVITRHSYAVWAQRFSVKLVPVTGEQAILWGIAYLGVALALLSNCYLQYDEKMAYYYQWPLGLGALLASGGILWYAWIAMLH